MWYICTLHTGICTLHTDIIFFMHIAHWHMHIAHWHMHIAHWHMHIPIVILTQITPHIILQWPWRSRHAPMIQRQCLWPLTSCANYTTPMFWPLTSHANNTTPMLWPLTPCVNNTTPMLWPLTEDMASEVHPPIANKVQDSCVNEVSFHLVRLASYIHMYLCLL